MAEAKPLYDTYNRVPIVFERGHGVWLETPEGERYLDLQPASPSTPLATPTRILSRHSRPRPIVSGTFPMCTRSPISHA
jgi:hypothetical protein